MHTFIQQDLDEIGVQMTYCNLETEDIRRFQSVYAYAKSEKMVSECSRTIRKMGRYEVRWKQKRNASIKGIEFPFCYWEGQKNLVALVHRTIPRKKKLFIEAPTGVGKQRVSGGEGSWRRTGREDFRSDSKDDHKNGCMAGI